MPCRAGSPGLLSFTPRTVWPEGPVRGYVKDLCVFQGPRRWDRWGPHAHALENPAGTSASGETSFPSPSHLSKLSPLLHPAPLAHLDNSMALSPPVTDATLTSWAPTSTPPPHLQRLTPRDGPVSERAPTSTPAFHLSSWLPAAQHPLPPFPQTAQEGVSPVRSHPSSFMDP